MNSNSIRLNFTNKRAPLLLKPVFLALKISSLSWKDVGFHNEDTCRCSRWAGIRNEVHLTMCPYCADSRSYSSFISTQWESVEPTHPQSTIKSNKCKQSADLPIWPLTDCTRSLCTMRFLGMQNVNQRTPPRYDHDVNFSFISHRFSPGRDVRYGWGAAW